jgi:RNA-binding protein YhbY
MNSIEMVDRIIVSTRQQIKDQEFVKVEVVENILRILEDINTRETLNHISDYSICDYKKIDY